LSAGSVAESYCLRKSQDVPDAQPEQLFGFYALTAGNTICPANFNAGRSPASTTHGAN
jgi:hypothetical protein